MKTKALLILTALTVSILYFMPISSLAQFESPISPLPTGTIPPIVSPLPTGTIPPAPTNIAPTPTNVIQPTNTPASTARAFALPTATPITFVYTTPIAIGVTVTPIYYATAIPTDSPTTVPTVTPSSTAYPIATATATMEPTLGEPIMIQTTKTYFPIATYNDIPSDFTFNDYYLSIIGDN